ncbi:MAG: DUF4214 domain-containing protein, partial [Methylococcaceae bacterium]
PTPTPAPVPVPQTVDGVVITDTSTSTTTTVTDPGTGELKTVILATVVTTIPIVEETRQEEIAATTGADIPLAKDSAGNVLLGISVPTGVGLTSEASTPNPTTPLTLREMLIAAAEPRATSPANFQAILQEGIDAYIPKVTDEAQVTVRTISFTSGTTPPNPTQPIVITGATGTGEGDAEHPQRQEALVIDVRNLPKGTPLLLNDVEFAIIIGAVRVQGGDGRNFVVGDNEDQFIVLGADDDILHGRGGNDTIGSLDGNDQTFGDAGNDAVYGGAGNDQVSGGSGNDRMNGGFGFDVALQSGTLTDYQVSTEGATVILTQNKIGEQDRFTDVEQIRFDSGTTLTLAHSQGEAVAAHLVGTWLHRDLTPDEGAYVQQHLSTSTANAIVNAFLTLPEAAKLSSSTPADLLAGLSGNPAILNLDIQRNLTGSDANDQGYLPLGLGLNVDGARGFDVLHLRGSLNDMHLAQKGGVLELTQLTDGAMVNLTNAEMLTFDSGENVVLAHNKQEGDLARLVHTFLNRSASADEWQLGVQALQSHVDPAGITNWLQDHAHLQNLTNQDYIQTLYQNTFDRAASIEELNKYQPQLDNGTLDRGVLAVELASSPEAVTTVGSVMTFEGWM